MHQYKDLNIWKNAMTIVKDVYELSEDLPKSEKYGLVSQITRAAVSIPSNIAEGSSRSSDKDFCRFLEISIGSAFELETQLLVCSEIYPSKANKIENIVNKLNENQKMIHGFILRLRN